MDFLYSMKMGEAFLLRGERMVVVREARRWGVEHHVWLRREHQKVVARVIVDREGCLMLKYATNRGAQHLCVPPERL